MRKIVGQALSASKQTQQNPCRTSPDIGAEQENYNVGRGSTKDKKGLRKSLIRVVMSLELKL
jgi:hypothetical protein